MKLLQGDCLDILPTLSADSVDCVCTDPPYGWAFMNSRWDNAVPGPKYWQEVLRVAKPGAHLVAFGGARTFHRLATAIEDAGWEVRDTLLWLQGQSMPKSLDVSKALDRAAGVEREVLGTKRAKGGDNANIRSRPNGNDSLDAKGCGAFSQGTRQIDIDVAVTAPATKLSKIYDGYGTAIKPAHEPILLCRKPLIGTVARTVERYGTGCLNIDGTRVPSGTDDLNGGAYRGHGSKNQFFKGFDRDKLTNSSFNPPVGRWPPNVLLSHALDCTDDACVDDCPVSMLDRQSGVTKSSGGGMNLLHKTGNLYGRNERNRKPTKTVGLGDTGGASRFFPRFRYNAKVSRKERDGCSHPTMKPIAVVEWLLTLIAPPLDRPHGQPVVLDPFMGSGTTGVAARNLGLDFVGIEREPEYHEFATKRI